MSTNKVVAIIVAIVLSFGVIGAIIWNGQQKKMEEIAKQMAAQKIEMEAQKAEVEKEIEAQKQQLDKQESDRLARKQVRDTEKKIEELKKELYTATYNRSMAESRLKQISEFQVMRSSAQKSSQITNQLNVIREWDAEVKRIQAEIQSLEQ